MGGAGAELDGAAAPRQLVVGEVGEGGEQDLAADDAGAAGDHVAAGEVLDGDVAEVQGDAAAGRGLLARTAAHVEGAGAQLAGAAVVAGGDEQQAGGLAQVGEVEAAGERRTGDDRRVGEARGELGEGCTHVGLREHERLGVAAETVELAQRDHAVAQAEQLADVQVLAGLRHHAFLGRDHQEHRVDAPGAGDHRAHEGLVAGDVDDAGRESAAELPGGEAELDGDAAALLLGEAVGVDAGEGADEGGLAVVDVAGGADDHGAGRLRHGERV